MARVVDKQVIGRAECSSQIVEGAHHLATVRVGQQAHAVEAIIALQEIGQRPRVRHRRGERLEVAIRLIADDERVVASEARAGPRAHARSSRGRLWRDVPARLGADRRDSEREDRNGHRGEQQCLQASSTVTHRTLLLARARF